MMTATMPIGRRANAAQRAPMLELFLFLTAGAVVIALAVGVTIAVVAVRARAQTLPAVRGVTAPAAVVAPWHDWRAPLDRDHPLVGDIWLPQEGIFIVPDAFADRLARHDIILIGEVHDNPDHHRLQAWLIAALTARGRAPAVVFEMIPDDRRAALADHLSKRPTDAAGLGAAVGWAEMGWPDWSMYAPIAEAALAARLPLVAGDLPRALRRQIGQQGLGVLSTTRRRQLALDRPLSPLLAASLTKELAASHCDLLPETALPAMAAVQRARDAALADAVIEARAAGSDGALLITGNGHIRTDRGVPWYLARRVPDARVFAVALAEVIGEALDADDLVPRAPTGLPAADAIWYTPRADDTDHCAALRAHRAREMMGEGDG